MFVSELDILGHCFQPIAAEGADEIKDGILIKRVENLPCKPSQSILAIGFDEEKSILFIQFNSGTTYRYFDAPRSLWQQFITTTGSVGSLYHQEIKGKFRGGKVNNLIEV